jgi:hypothetical protein
VAVGFLDVEREGVVDSAGHAVLRRCALRASRRGWRRVNWW